MTFHPNMESRIQGISLVEDLRWRAWPGVIADVWHVACDGDAGGEYVSQAPRLVVVLDAAGVGGLDISLSRGPGERCGGALSYVPAGVRVWSRVQGLRALRHLDIHFDRTALEERLSGAVNADVFDQPRLGFSDDRLLAVARLIAEECTATDSTPDLYADSLITALSSALFGTDRRLTRRRGVLSPRQLRRALDYIEANCRRTIRLRELADLTGLSQAYFCSAFKASTGMPPLKWQQQARVGEVMSMLKRRDTPLAAVAAEVGFADQAHLTRVFRQIVGTTPAAWMRNHAA